MSKLPEYQLDRLFNAPRALVWRAWTEPELLARWYGPGVETIIHQFDLEPGGIWLNEMKWADKSMKSKALFMEVETEQKLVWHHSSTDADWNIAANPMMPDWPRTLLTTVTFSDADAGTKVRLTQIPIDPTEAEITCFADKMSGMDNGWGSGYKIIDEMLAEQKAGK
ncbi:SRPBCC domain-containing protein [Devosia rhodophyticola]|uniref:SRPBCC domain-containing protein n=1 Tax=Devosia rhodophyticola TaxID=3026423 RepID=A0ABY7YVP7_9HYPH|nr:SRPBCC domain-containing protein [Devosia rhodophyticola]WDR05125.1 SRPBCC domain-containing protein [Devosia rhodophyticola]